MNTTSNNRAILTELNPKEYEHPLDRKALKDLQAVPLLSKTLDIINAPYEKVSMYTTMSSHLQVGENQFPTIYKKLLEACEILEVPEPLLYVSADPSMDAITSNPENPVIVLSSYLIDRVTAEELLFFLGHELAYIKSGHIVYSALGYALEKEILGGIAGVVPVPGFSIAYKAGNLLLRTAFRKWKKAADYSGDRAGLLACQNYSVACNALMKMSGASEQFDEEMSVDAFIAQSETLAEIDEDSFSIIEKIIANSKLTQTKEVKRMNELSKFVESGDYALILRREYEVNPPPPPEPENSESENGETPDNPESAPAEVPDSWVARAAAKVAANLPGAIPAPTPPEPPVATESAPAPAAEPVFCTMCGKENVGDSKFCISCGKAIRTTVAASN